MSSALTSSPVEIWYSRCGAATASELALRKGWVDDEFSDPSRYVLRSLKDSPDVGVRNAHYHHGQTGLFREGGNIPPVWAKGIGSDTVVVGITWLDEYQGVLVRADSDIRDLSDLGGKRLAIPLRPQAVIDFQRGAAQHGFQTALGLVGLSPTDAALTDVVAEGSDTARRDPVLVALEAGEVDAAFVRMARGVAAARDPRFRQLVNINELSDPLQRVNNGTPRPITVDRAFLEAHPDVVVRYLSVLLRTAEWAAAHPDETFALLADWQRGSTVDDIRASHGDDAPRSFTPQLNETYLRGLEIQKEFLREWGYFDDDFSVADWVVREPLEQAQALLRSRATA